MACAVTLPLWPSATDCISWSEDNCIAVTGGDSIAILTPRLKSAGPDGTFWDSTVFKVNGFSKTEVPRSPPASEPTWSVAEELSLRDACAAKWSSSGLGKHRSSALAVLTANHVLSIWATDTKPPPAASWSREVVINHTVQEFYRQNHLAITAKSDVATLGDFAWRQRITAFAWSSPLHNRPGNQTHLDNGAHLIAAATSGGHILFLHVLTPYHACNPYASEWKVVVCGCIDLNETSSRSEVHGLQMTPHDSQARYPRNVPTASDVAWSAWKWATEDTAHSYLAYITRGELFTCQLTATKSNGALSVDLCSTSEQGLSSRHLHHRNDLYGPLRFGPTPFADSLFVFGEDIVAQIDLSATAQPSSQMHDLDDRWDNISGIAFTNSEAGSSQISLTSHLSTLRSLTHTLRLPISPQDRSARIVWRDVIQDSAVAYGNKYDLKGNVQERVWGIAASPLRNYIATCTTLHPDDTLSYVIQVDQKCIINITWETELTSDEYLPTLAHNGTTIAAPIDALIFELQRHFERATEAGTLQDPYMAQRLTGTIEKLLPASPEGTIEGSREYRLDDIHATNVVAHLKHDLLSHGILRSARASRLCNAVLGLDGVGNKLDIGSVRVLVETVLALPVDSLAMCALDTRVLAIYRTISRKLNLSRDSGDDAPGSGSQAPETCQVCQAAVNFESLKWARCVRGHQFSRCALTFLTIQQPQSTKSCAICNIQYINETTFSEFQHQSMRVVGVKDVADRPESCDPHAANYGGVQQPGRGTAVPLPPGSLAQILFSACDLCVYCGGRYTD